MEENLFVDPEGSDFVKIEAVVKPFRAEDVKEQLVALGVSGVTSTEVKGFGRQRGHTALFRGAEYTTDYLPKYLITVIVERARANEVVRGIIRSSNDSKIGSGIITVSAVENIVRIRTSEHGKGFFAS